MSKVQIAIVEFKSNPMLSSRGQLASSKILTSEAKNLTHLYLQLERKTETKNKKPKPV